MLDENMRRRKNARTKKCTDEKMHRRKNAQTKICTDEKMRDEKKADENLQTKNCQTKKYQTKIGPVTQPGYYTFFALFVVQFTEPSSPNLQIDGASILTMLVISILV